MPLLERETGIRRAERGLVTPGKGGVLKGLRRYGPPALGYTLSALVGLFVATQLPWLSYLDPVISKVRGQAKLLPWSEVLATARYGQSLLGREADMERGVKLLESDPKLPVRSWRLPGYRAFWIPCNGQNMDGRRLLCYLAADHSLLDQRYRDNGVQEGEIVLDCGAHVGVFTDRALRRGARKVVAIEPDPLNRLCLERNFAVEINSGRVIVVPQGVWKTKGLLEFHTGKLNSGSGSVVIRQPSPASTIQVTTIDDIVSSLRLERVDFIKLDIEGAEPQALEGATNTLRAFRPRLMLDAYHRVDDAVVLPRIIRAACADYTMHRGPFEHRREGMVPHVIFFK